jgi:ribosome assembly protein RRB1
VLTVRGGARALVCWVAADDGSFRVWDLRSFSSGEPVARFHWHKAPITSVEWSPHESSTIAVAGADHQLTMYGLACLDLA